MINSAKPKKVSGFINMWDYKTQLNEYELTGILGLRRYNYFEASISKVTTGSLWMGLGRSFQYCLVG
tara:strand:+ start:7302 stop:7502 length:201 start_codon:yes stop_codon:yes gene_type:complete